MCKVWANSRQMVGNVPCPQPLRTLAWAHTGLCLAPGLGPCPGPLAACGRPKNTASWTKQHIIYLEMRRVLYIDLCKYGTPKRNDYHYKDRMWILYKKTCCTAPHCSFRYDFLGNHLKDGTLAWMWNQRSLAWMSSSICHEWIICVLFAHDSVIVCWQ